MYLGSQNWQAREQLRFDVFLSLIKAFVLDACCLQISSNFEKNPQSKACDDAIIRFETAENANQIFGQAVEEIQYENDVSHLYQS